MSKAAASQAYGQVPLSFEVNQGQTDSSVKFLAHTAGLTYFITPSELVMSLSTSKPPTDPKIGIGPKGGGVAAKPAGASPPDVVHMRLTGANPNPTVEGMDELPGKTNYFIGNDPAKWHTGVAAYAKVELHNVYPGIDLVYYGTQQGLEYDINVAPGANPGGVGLDFTGAPKVDLDADGAVQVHTSAGTLVQRPAIVYQQSTGGRTGVRAHYVVRGNNHVGVSLGRYDHQKALVIDPSLLYSTYLGGAGYGNGIAVDGSGNAYITGYTSGNLFVTEVNAGGSALVYSTYLGGSGYDDAQGIAVDGSGNAYITGVTASTDFPTHNPIQSALAGSYNAFVTEVNAGGSALVYSTYLGGSSLDEGFGIAVDGSSNAYITGQTTSTDFPTHNPIQSALAGSSNAFVTEVNAGGSAPVYSTYLGGSGYDYSQGIAVDGSGNAYITGITESTDFPTHNPVQPATTNSEGTRDAFVTEVDAGGSALVYSTYLGGSSDDGGDGIAVDGSGNAYITGYTYSADFPTHNPIQPATTNSSYGTRDAFVTEVNAGGSALVYSTYLGGSSDDYGNGIAVDGSGNAYITGITASTDFPTHNPIQSALAGSYNAFVTEVNAGGSALGYSTYLGGPGYDYGFGIAVDGSGNAYITGYPAFVTVISPNDPTQFPPSGGTLALSEISAPNSSEPNARCQACAADPVNTADGTYGESATDLSLAGRSYPLAFSRSYTSANPSVGGPLGFGWAPSYSMHLGVSGSIVTVTQENGSTVTFTLSGGVYTAPPRVIATLTLSGGVYTFVRDGRDTYTFNSSGQLTSERDLNGYTTLLAYGGGNLSTVTDPAGRALTFSWTGSHITTVTDANVSPSRVVTYQYNDGNGNLTDVIDVGGGHTHLTYDSNHQMLSMLDPKCYATSGCPGIQNTYSGGEVIAQDDQLNRLTTFSYSVSQAMSLTAATSTTTVTDPVGNVVVDNYQYGLLTSEARGYGTPQAATIQYRYDPNTLARTLTIDANTNPTEYTVDSSGNPLTVVDQLGRTTVNTYNSFNELLTSEDPNQAASVSYGASTTNTYDGNGNPTSTSRPLTGSGQQMTTYYRYQDPDHPGDVTSTVDPDGNVSNYMYDAYGDKTESIDPLGNRTISVFNADGWMTASYSPKGSAPVVRQLAGGGIGTGNGWSMALRNDGRVYAWGYNSDGEVGNGTTTGPVTAPSKVCAPGQTAPCSQFFSGATSVAAGGLHGIVSKSDGTAWAWGNNAIGQLGTGTTTSAKVPVQVTGLTGVTVTGVAAGLGDSFALTSAGTVYAWGANDKGQVGDGTVTTRKSPKEVCAPSQTAPCTQFLSGITAIASHRDFTLALKSDGTVYAWGANGHGRLGNGLTANSSVPVQACAAGQTAPCSQFLTNVVAIAPGKGFSMALVGDGTVDTWGSNTGGELGNGASDASDHAIPIQVPGLPPVTAIAAGSLDGLALAADGTLRSWGLNDHGQLGVGAKDTTGCTCRVTPQTVSAISQVSAIAGGDASSLATTEGSTWAWGYDGSGELGDGNSSGSVTTPAPFSGIQGTLKTTYETTYAHNAFGQVTTMTDPLGHAVVHHFDADNNQDALTDGNGNVTTYVHDLANELTQTKRADSPQTTVTTDYNFDGTTADQKDGRGNAILTYGYDSLDRMTTSTDALGNVTTYGYDAVGNRLTQQNPGGNCATPSKCTTTTYDADNEPTAATYSDGVTPNVTSITYDRDGQRTGMTDGTGSSAWVFDSLHRMTSYTNGNSSAVSYVYNLRDLPTTVTYPGSHAVTNSYDNAGRMTSVQDWLGSPNTTSFGYDVNSNLTSDKLQSGIVDSYTYNAADQQTAISDVNGGTTIFAASYTRDSNAQLASDSSQAANQGSYKYTSLNQLCYAGSSSSTACASAPTNSYPYGFDAADNLTMMENAGHTGTNAQQFNAADQLCWTVAGASANACGSAPTGATTFNYDDRGNRTSQVPSGGSATCTAFDQADQLTSVKTGTGSTCTSPTTVGTYAYDGSGMRQSKTVSGTTTQFLWSGSDSTQALLDEKAGAANPTYSIYGPGWRPVEQVDPSGNAHFYHADQIGSVRAVTNTSGTVDATYTYDPHGNVVSSTNPGSITNNLQFQGQYLDAETGIYYLRARYYSPTDGQFMSRDPMVASTMSPYAYVSGNPLNLTDPSGLLFGLDSALGAAVGAAVGTALGAGGYLASVATGQQQFSGQGLAAAGVGGLVGGAIAGACTGTVWVAVAACGAAGGAAGSFTTDLINGRSPSVPDIVEGAAFGAAGGVAGARFFELQGARPYKLSNVWNPGINSIRLYGQGIVSGSIGLIQGLIDPMTVEAMTAGGCG